MHGGQNEPGFEAVDPRPDFIETLSDAELARLLDDMKAKKLEFGAVGLPVDFRLADSAVAEQMKRVPAFAKTLQRAGAKLVNKPIWPTHDKLTYRKNFQQHLRRLGEVASVLDDHGVRLGLEYCGPKTVWASQRYPFVHTMAEARELIGELGRPNIGLTLDSYHWYTAGETEADLLSLRKEEVFSVDIDDAPAGIPVDQQEDHHREVPLATGVIDLATFLNALNRVGFDGPVRAEPLGSGLRKLPREQAVAAAAEAMKKAFALIR